MAPAPSEFHHTSNTVCVMDASGYLGSTLVHRLLQRGCIVHAAVQNHGLGDWKLNKLCGDDNKKLKIFNADPFDYLSIVEALRGCSGLFYTFEPPQDQTTYDEFTAEEEVRAAHNVLEACAQTETIDKVVFTSSATAIFWRDDHSSDFDERHWSDVNFCRKYKLWYGLAKTLAEKTAWALAMDRGLNMVSINGGLLMSPDLSIKNPYLKGAAEMYEDGVFVTVDINFLVDSHICVFEDVSSYGRYLCFNSVVNHPEDAFKLASMLTPSAPSLPPSSYEQETRIIQPRISCKKLNKLMMEFESRSQR
ncbi:hypothetical protein Pint_03456 [Pistacia integerrima]|uniref:Uncharacterized protein n=1 Tax=Pistacia integerrima TaxID=434235 RepID=A0ACC0ZK06_9ROSI|nr:hypothetical protein Pint_03456 [Pistacia integerrima]